MLTHIRNQIRFCSIVPLPLLYAVLKVIDFPRYSSKGNGENKILRGIFRVVSLFPLHFVLYSILKFGLLFGQCMYFTRVPLTFVFWNTKIICSFNWYHIICSSPQSRDHSFNLLLLEDWLFFNLFWGQN